MSIAPSAQKHRRQATSTLLMIRPVAFRMNEQTAVNNYYQKNDVQISPANVNSIAQEEFDNLVAILSAVGVNVIVVNDTTTTDTPDSIFPNNWVSFHDFDDEIKSGKGLVNVGNEGGGVTSDACEPVPATGGGFAVLYPMFAENRRLERRPDILDMLKDKYNFAIENTIDLSSFELKNQFLEGTGSIIFDRVSRKAYCALSPRADRDLLEALCERILYTPVIFEAFQSVQIDRASDCDNGAPVMPLPTVRKHIYHTNVMMCVADNFAVVCLDSIDDATERQKIVDSLNADGKLIIEISEDQVNKFAGNMLEVKGRDDQRYLVMSTTAFESLGADQIFSIKSRGCEILHSDISVIEKFGGGSARCMLCEIFLN